MIIDADEVRIFQRRSRPMAHVHPCPECYSAWPCAFLTCTIEPDLQLDNGVSSGFYEQCGRCTIRGIAAVARVLALICARRA